MPYPVSVKEAVKIANEVQSCIEDAAVAGRLRAAVDIILEYISASLCLDVIDDLQDMLADTNPLPVPRTAEEWRELWSRMHPAAAKEGTPE